MSDLKSTSVAEAAESGQADIKWQTCHGPHDSSRPLRPFSQKRHLNLQMVGPHHSICATGEDPINYLSLECKATPVRASTMLIETIDFSTLRPRYRSNAATTSSAFVLHSHMLYA